MTMRVTITLLTFALIAGSCMTGCEIPPDEPILEARRPLGHPAEDALVPEFDDAATTRDGDLPDTEALAADEPSGQILVGELHVDAVVGEVLLITFEAELFDIDPEDTYFTANAIPDGAQIDFGTGVFEWTPVPADVGTHVVGLDLWDGDAGRVLDAQRIVIEVLPGSSLIEVGI